MMEVRDWVIDEPLPGFVYGDAERFLSVLEGLVKQFGIGVVSCVWWMCA